MRLFAECLFTWVPWWWWATASPNFLHVTSPYAIGTSFVWNDVVNQGLPGQIRGQYKNLCVLDGNPILSAWIKDTFGSMVWSSRTFPSLHGPATKASIPCSCSWFYQTIRCFGTPSCQAVGLTTKFVNIFCVFNMWLCCLAVVAVVAVVSLLCFVVVVVFSDLLSWRHSYRVCFYWVDGGCLCCHYFCFIYSLCVLLLIYWGCCVCDCCCFAVLLWFCSEFMFLGVILICCYSWSIYCRFAFRGSGCDDDGGDDDDDGWMVTMMIMTFPEGNRRTNSVCYQRFMWTGRQS